MFKFLFQAKRKAREAERKDNPNYNKNNLNEKGVRKDWPEIRKENENFEAYYKVI